MDESTKTVLIDSTKNIKKIIGVIGAKLNLKNPEEYSLKKLDSRDGKLTVFLLRYSVLINI